MVDPARVYLTDDHPLVREALGWFLGQRDEIVICGQSASRTQAFQEIVDLQPNLCVTDLDLPDGSGLELMKDVHAQSPEIPFLFLSMFDDLTYAPRVIAAGAKGYLVKDSTPDTILKAVGTVLSGEVYASQAVLSKIMASRQSRDGRTGVDLLSDREMEVLTAIGYGKTSKRIAEELCLSPKTIDTHRERIKDKLSVSDSVALTRYAVMFVSRPSIAPIF